MGLITGLLIAAVICLWLVGRRYWPVQPNPQVGIARQQHDQVQAEQEHGEFARMPQWRFERFIPLPELPEPSGLCYCGERGSFFAVDDGDALANRPSAVWELDLSGEPLRKLDLGSDLEGVCWAQELGVLFAVDEADSSIYVLNATNLEVMSVTRVSSVFQGREAFTPGGNGFEGIEYLPGSGERPRTLALLNQDDPTCLVLMDAEQVLAASQGADVQCYRIVMLQQMNAGELRFRSDAGELWVVHSWMNVMEVLDPHSFEVRAWEVVPGCAQEAVAFGPDGKLWIGQDTGGLAIYQPNPELLTGAEGQAEGTG